MISPDPDGGGALLYPATRTTYPTTGANYSVVSQGTTTNQSATALTTFTALQTARTEFDGRGLKLTEIAAFGSGHPGITQYSYDNEGRLTCAALRMDPASYSSLPASACVQVNTAGQYGPNGPDRISTTTYDVLDRPTEIRVGYGTTEVQIDRAQAYTGNGQVAWAEDGAGNRSAYVYDRYDRLARLEFPSATVGAQAANPLDYEEYGYDANDNPTTKRTRAALTFTTTFDALNRITHIDAPSGTPDSDFTYDNLGRRLTAVADGLTFTSVWDALGRNLGEYGPLGDVGYLYDLAGRMTLMSYYDGQWAMYQRSPR